MRTLLNCTTPGPSDVRWFDALPSFLKPKSLNDDPAHQAIVDSFHAKWRLERKAAIARRMRKEIHR